MKATLAALCGLALLLSTPSYAEELYRGYDTYGYRSAERSPTVVYERRGNEIGALLGGIAIGAILANEFDDHRHSKHRAHHDHHRHGHHKRHHWHKRHYSKHRHHRGWKRHHHHHHRFHHH